MSLSSISWHIGLLVGSSSPALPITPSPKEWLALVGSTVGSHCRSEPHQECVPGEIPTSTPAVGSEQLQSLQVIGGELDPSEIVGDGPRPRACRAMGWVGAHGRVPLVATLSRRDDDPTPTTGRTSRWSGTGSWSVSSRKRARTPSASRVPWDGCPPDHVPAAGTRHHPNGMISRRPRPGRISPPKAVVSSPRATDGNPRLDSMVRAASKARTRWPLICGFRCPAEDPSHEGVPEVGDPEVHVRVVGQRGGEPEAGKRGDDHLERLGRVAAVGGRVGQRVDHLGPVPERLGPAVGADQWDRVRPTPRRRMKCTGTPSTWTR
jgi:hypothetical protein